MENKFEPEIELVHEERGHLAALTTMPGFAIYQRLQRAEVDKFFIRHMATDEADADAIIANFKFTKAAAHYYQRITDRVNIEIQSYTSAVQRGSEKPIDITADLLDIGPQHEDMNFIPDLLGEEQF